MRPDRFHDNSKVPIIAIDFDKTICMGHSYPDPNNGELRPHTRNVIKFMMSAGIAVTIWTNREESDIEVMKQYLSDHDIQYTSINDTSELAPYRYDARKIYAHCYVDDRAYGWYDSDDIMLDALHYILCNTLEIPLDIANDICKYVENMDGPEGWAIEYVKRHVEQW